MRRSPSIAIAALVAAACSGDGTEPSRDRIELDRSALELRRFDQDSIRAVVYDRGGKVVNPSIVWSSTDPATVEVDTEGAVVARRPGRATITATWRTLAARAEVTVIGDGTAPTIAALRVTPSVVDLGGGEVRVVASVEASDDEGGVAQVDLVATPPSAVGMLYAPIGCLTGTLDSGTPKRGTWSCAWVLNRYVEAGAWTLHAFARDTSNTRTATLTFTVGNTLRDERPPELARLSVDAHTDAQGNPRRRLELRAVDPESGVEFAEMFFEALTEPRLSGVCGERGIGRAAGEWRASHDRTVRCDASLGSEPSPWIWTITKVVMRDVRGNVRELDTAALRAAGFPTEFDLGTP